MRAWDSRRLDESLAVLKGVLGSIRLRRFSRDGKWLAVAEPEDLLYIVALGTPDSMHVCCAATAMVVR